MSFVWERVRSWLGEVKPCRKWAEAKLLGNCEPGAEIGSVAEPVNAWSNAAYPLAGLIAWAVQGTAEAGVFAAAMGFLGLGSFLYHAWPTVRSAALDHSGMYAVFAVLAVYAASGGNAPYLPWLLAVSGAGAAWAFRFAFAAPLQAMMGLFLWLAAVAAWGTGSVALLVGGLALFAWAMVAWQLDRRTEFLGRWGHGSWHLFTGAAALCLWLAQ